MDGFELAGIALTQLVILATAILAWLRTKEGTRVVRGSDTKLDEMKAQLHEFAARNDADHKTILEAHPHAASTAFRLAYQHSDVAAYEVVPDDIDRNYRLTWANQACLDLWGMTMEEAELQHPDTVHDMDRDRIQAAVRRAAAQGESLSIWYTNINVRTNETTKVASRMELYKNLAGGPAGWIGTIWPDE